MDQNKNEDTLRLVSQAIEGLITSSELIDKLEELHECEFETEVS